MSKMEDSFELRELRLKQDILKYLPVLNELYPSLNLIDYAKELDFMLKHNYGQLAVFYKDVCVAICGFWIGNKLWCGKYLELDNIVVRQKYRRLGVGKRIMEYMHAKAIEENCTMLSLDSYTTNYKAHRLFYNEGFAPKGFHFIKVLKEEGIR